MTSHRANIQRLLLGALLIFLPNCALLFANAQPPWPLVSMMFFPWIGGRIAGGEGEHRVFRGVLACMLGMLGFIALDTAMNSEHTTEGRDFLALAVLLAYSAGVGAFAGYGVPATPQNSVRGGKQ